MAYSRPCCKKGLRLSFPTWSEYFLPACLATGYVPAIWRQVKVVFIPKPGRNTYSGSRDYRPISLTSFLLKTMERPVNRYLRDETLAIVPLHPNKHAYQACKLVETTLHQLVVRVEKVLDYQETALGTFLDIEGAFKNTIYDTIVVLCSGMLAITPLCGGLGPP